MCFAAGAGSTTLPLSFESLYIYICDFQMLPVTYRFFLARLLDKDPKTRFVIPDGLAGYVLYHGQLIPFYYNHPTSLRVS